MTKYNSFNLIYEKAFAKYANGGAFRENTPIKIKDSYFSSPYFKQRYSGDKVFCDWLTNLVKLGIFFFIHKLHADGTMMDRQDANDYAGANNLYLTIKTDPRNPSYPTEFSEFQVPADFKFLEVLDFGPNLPPVQGVPNKYEQPITDYTPQEAPSFIKIGNSPKDNSLTKKNINIKIKK
jgi:hypothetical protein